MTSGLKEREPYETILFVVREEKPETVQKLVDLVKQRLPNSNREIVDAILDLQNHGKIKLTAQREPVKHELTTFLKTDRALWFWITIAVSIATVSIVFVVPEDFLPWIYMRYVFGAIFVLWLPGYTFIKALFPAQLPIEVSDKNLDAVVRIALSFGTSITLVPIVGLLLNYTPWGVRLVPIVAALFALTIVFATGAIIRENQTRRQEANSQNTNATAVTIC